MNYSIRKYQPKDKPSLRSICMQTAGGVFKKSSRLLNAVPLIYSDYFTECESDNIFVLADENDYAVGYILCSSDTALFKKKMKSYMKKAIKMHPFMIFVSVGYLSTVYLFGKGNKPHLHIDIIKEYQHIGAGTQLINTLRDYLYSKGIETLYVNSISTSADAYPFYIKYGFKPKNLLGKNFVSLSISSKRS